MSEKLFDTNLFGNFFVPTNVINFLIALTSPLPQEKVLDINLNPDVTLSFLEGKTGIRAHYLKSNSTKEDLSQTEQLYDVILCGPSFGSMVRSPDGSSEPNEVFWLKWCIHHLSDKGRLAILVPTGLLSNHSQQNSREFLISQGGLKAIIELPTGWTKQTSSQASILYITKASNPSKDIKMFRFTKHEAIPWTSLASLVLNDKVASEQEGISFSVNFSKLDLQRLDVQYYFSMIDQMSLPNPNIFMELQLDDIVTIGSGENFSKVEFQTNGIPFVQVRNVTVKGTLDLKNVKTIFPEIAMKSRGYCSQGNVIVTTAGTLGKVALIDSTIANNGICIDTSLRRLQILDMQKIFPEYLAIYLRTPIAQQQIKSLASGSVIPNLTSSSLRGLKIFLPSLEKQQEIIAIYSNSKLSDKEKFENSFYDKNQGPEPPTPITHKQLPVTETEPQSSPLPEVIQNKLPFPIARTYTFFTNSTHLLGNVRVKRLIDLSESIVYYVYNVLVSDQIKRLNIKDAELKRKMKGSFTSYSIKRRLEVVFHILKLARNDSSIDLFIPELLNIDLGVCMEIQNNVRNGMSHNSALPENRCKQIIKEFQPKLEKLLDSLRPLKDYILTQTINITVHEGILEHHVFPMMGYNSLFLPQIVELEKENVLLADSLHVILLAQKRGYDFLDLHPFYLMYAWVKTGEEDHLCFFKHVVFKQVIGSMPEQLKVESTHGGANDTTTETDMEFNNIVPSDIIPLQNRDAKEQSNE